MSDPVGMLMTPRHLTDDERESLKAAFLAKGCRASYVVGGAAFVIQRRKRSTDIDALLSAEGDAR